MKKALFVTSFEQTKLLADSRRLQILEWLMDSPATLTQLGARLGQSPARVRHHLQRLLDARLVEQAEIRVRGTVTEKYYRATAGAFIIQKMILPQGKRPALLFAGSHDLMLEDAAQKISPHLNLIFRQVGSLDGLVALRQGLCHLSGVHLLDESGVYNTPYLSRLFPQRRVQAVTLAHRIQGLMVAAGNPKGIRGFNDLRRGELRFVNRNAGSGTRLWLDKKLREAGIAPQEISGYKNICCTHTAAAQKIAQGEADLAIGLQAAAQQYGLEFFPLFEERFDIIIPSDYAALADPLLDEIQSASFRSLARKRSGYNLVHSGERVAY